MADKPRQIVNSQFGVNVESVNDLAFVQPELGALVMYRGILHFGDGKKWVKLAIAK